MRTAILHGRVITPFQVIEDGGVLIENGKILAVLDDSATAAADDVFDAEGLYVSPGFIDIHTHGGGGFDYMDGTLEAFVGAAKTHLRYGTTSLTPTTLSCSDEELFTVLQCYETTKAELTDGPNLLGLHLEGPYFAPTQAGAQDPRYLRLPDTAHVRSLLNASGSIVRMSAAAELPGALALGDELKKRGILASIGHSDALYSDVVEAVKHGYRLVTHLYSGMSMLKRIGAWRHLGLVESAYLLDELSVEIIADGCHLPPELLQLIVKLKPWDKICLITDSMRGAGLAEGEIVKLGSLDHGQDVILEDGVAMLMDRTAFAGSICTADRCIRTMVKKAGLSIQDAVRMMTVNPARLIGAGNKGALASGYDADICVFDDNVQIKRVMVGGEFRYSEA
jgi:N-acetylglucosamine-6-phosphate deacetylase